MRPLAGCRGTEKRGSHSQYRQACVQNCPIFLSPEQQCELSLVFRLPFWRHYAATYCSCRALI